jgi:hypothetical protein
VLLSQQPTTPPTAAVCASAQLKEAVLQVIASLETPLMKPQVLSLAKKNVTSPEARSWRCRGIKGAAVGRGEMPRSCRAMAAVSAGIRGT